jgi:hypothetical protein
MGWRELLTRELATEQVKLPPYRLGILPPQPGFPFDPETQLLDSQRQ